MKIVCPGCAKTLAVPENLAGRRVKCPGCQQAIDVPATAGVEIMPAANALRAVAAVPPSSTKKGPPPLPDSARVPAAPSEACPECGASLDVGALECVECGWMEEMDADRDADGGQDVQGSGKRGRCYVNIRRDSVDLNHAVEKRIKKLIETEQLRLRITHNEPDLSESLRPNDLIIMGKITKCDYGNRMMRYFLTFLAALGPGSCQLDAEIEVETAEGGKRRFRAWGRQFMGLFGGSDEGLMKVNVKAVGTTIANKAARHLTGRSLLNAHAYVCGWWSLGLGVPALIPYCGIPFGLPGLVLGGMSLMTILQRKLPRGHIVAIIGLVLPLLGIGMTAALFLAATMRK